MEPRGEPKSGRAVVADQTHLNKRPSRPGPLRATGDPEALVVAARDLFADRC